MTRVTIHLFPGADGQTEKIGLDFEDEDKGFDFARSQATCAYASTGEGSFIFYPSHRISHVVCETLKAKQD